MVQIKNDLVGKQFGRLTVLQQVEDYITPNSGKHYAQWLCECSCEEGKTVIVTSNNLISGATKSCGCLKSESTSMFNTQTKHKTNDYDLDSCEYGIGYSSNTHTPFFFDKENYDLIKDFCWNDHIKTNGYHILEAWNTKTKQNIPMTELLGCKGYDHENRNSLDNRRCNLRPATQADNTKNKSRQKNNTSGIAGVGWMKRLNKWRARITIDDTPIYLGIFENKDDAIRARLQAEKQYFGEFAPQKHLFELYNI